MELSDYFRILRTRGWIIVVVAVVAAVSAFGFSKLQRPIYKSSMQVTVLPARNDQGLAQTTKQLLRAYVTIMDTKNWAQQVLDHLAQDGHPQDMTPEQLKNNVIIASYEDKNVIQIDAKDGTGEQANRIAWLWAQEFEAWRNLENGKVRKEDQVDVKLGDFPTFSRYRPQTQINVAAGGIFGVLLGALIVAALEWIDSGVVRTPADVERKLGLAVLGVIPASER
jgi:capsular polysaccharide biosynthesis protein